MFFICLFCRFIDRFAPCALARLTIYLHANLRSSIATSICTHANVTFVINVLVVVLWTKRGRIGLCYFFMVS